MLRFTKQVAIPIAAEVLEHVDFENFFAWVTQSRIWSTEFLLGAVQCSATFVGIINRDTCLGL